MIDRYFFIVLVLNATGLFAFIAPQVGVTIGKVSLILLVLNVFYLIVRGRYTKAVVRRGGMGEWLFVMLIWPLFTLVYASSFEIREIGLQLYYLTLFGGAVVYTVANGLPAMRRVLSVSLAVSIVGLVLSMMAPQYFETVAALADSRSVYTGRAYGFFMQPNVAATSFAIIFVGWFALWEHRKFLHEVLGIIVFMLVMLLTGSRTGVLMAVIVIVFIQTFSFKKRLARGRYLLKACILLGCMVGGLLVMRYYVSIIGNTEARQKGDVIDRIETMLSFRLSDEGGINNDKSVQMRLLAQTVYWSLFFEKPLMGHGFGSDTYYKETGPIFLSAHSQALTSAMEYGVLYPAAFILLMLYLYKKHDRRDVEKIFQTNSIGQLVFIVIVLFTINGDLFDNRTFYVVWGMFFAAVYYPRYIFRFDEKTGRIAGLLIRRKNAKHSAGKWRLLNTSESSITARIGVAQDGGTSG